MKHKRWHFIFILAACIGVAGQAFAAQSAPTYVQAAPGNASAAVSFQAPAAESGSSITGYTVVSIPSAGIDSNAGSTSLIHVITGLANNVAYTFTVTAANSLGNTSSPSEASNSVTPSDSAYASSAGTYNVVAMNTGVGALWAQTCVQVASPDGTYSLNCTDVYGNHASQSCSAWRFPYGDRVTCTPPPPVSDFLCYGNTSGTVTSCTASVNDYPGATYFAIGIKQGSGYTSSDLEGAWYGEGLDTYTGGNSCEHDNGSVTDTGNITDYITLCDGTKITKSGILSFTGNGQTTGEFNYTDNSGISSGFIDANKTVGAGFTSYSVNDIMLHVVSKQAASYSLADLAGHWAGNQLHTADTWRRMIFEVNGDGSFTKWQASGDGTTSSTSGTLGISSAGAVTCVSGDCSNFNAVMDASKTVITATRTHKSGTDYSLLVLTKGDTSLWQNATPTGGGWYYLNPFGALYPTDSGWIYHETLGWLYTDAASTDSIWFFDPQWNGVGGWWWTSGSFFPWVYSATQDGWLWFDAEDSGPGARWFFTGAGQPSTH